MGALGTRPPWADAAPEDAGEGADGVGIRVRVRRHCAGHLGARQHQSLGRLPRRRDRPCRLEAVSPGVPWHDRGVRRAALALELSRMDDPLIATRSAP